MPLVEIISDAKAGEVKHERTGAGDAADVPLPASRTWRRPRPPAASSWPTGSRRKENPYFAKSYVNRIWSYLLGVGIIEPVDDIRAGNPPTNPKLLDRLTERVRRERLQRAAADQDDLQDRAPISIRSRPTSGTRTTTINYSHALARRLPAEVLYDAIHRATGSTSKLPGLPPGARAAQLLDSDVRTCRGLS